MSTSHTLNQEIAWIDAHGGSTADWICSSTYARATGSMEGWRAHLWGRDDRTAELSKHIELENGHVLMLDIGLAHEHVSANGKPIRWSATLRVDAGRYVRVHGYSPDLPSALQAATGYRHESRQIGPLTWWKQTGDEWVSWLGDRHLRANCIKDSVNNTIYWHFEAFGQAPTFEEAALLASMRPA